jgi:hypothetical protein
VGGFGRNPRKRLSLSWATKDEGLRRYKEMVREVEMAGVRPSC